MVDSFLWEESNLVECFRDELFLAPVDVPVIVFCLAILSVGERLLDAVGEEGLELDLATG